MSVEEFVKQYYPWLIHICQKHHSKFGRPIGSDIGDMVQEAVLMLPEILAKYDEYQSKLNGDSKPCAITSFVWNRLRGKFRDNSEIEFRKMRAKLEYGVDQILETDEQELFSFDGFDEFYGTD